MPLLRTGASRTTAKVSNYSTKVGNAVKANSGFCTAKFTSYSTLENARRTHERDYRPETLPVVRRTKIHDFHLRHKCRAIVLALSLEFPRPALACLGNCAKPSVNGRELSHSSALFVVASFHPGETIFSMKFQLRLARVRNHPNTGVQSAPLLTRSNEVHLADVYRVQ